MSTDSFQTPDHSILALDEAMSTFAQLASRQAMVVELRYFGGLSEDEICEAFEISPRTVRRDWEFAGVWLGREVVRFHDTGVSLVRRGWESPEFGS